LSILFVSTIVLVDILRRGAFTSKVWFECVWLSVFWLLHLCGAAATTASVPDEICTARFHTTCSTARVLFAVTWAATLLLLAQLLLTLIASIHHTNRHPEVWKSGVRDFQWFNGGGSTVLSSRPASLANVGKAARDPEIGSVNPVPHLEKMAATWKPASTIRVQAMVAAPASKIASIPYLRHEPQPLTLQFAPELPPSREPVHYSATATISVGILPGRRPSTKKALLPPAAPSLYPASLCPSLDSQTSSDIPNIPSPRLPSTQPAQEPFPVRNWPRHNPQEPIRTDKSHGMQYVPHQVIPERTPLDKAPSNSVPSIPTRGPRGPRRRPPPLDLSAASPTLHRS
jgi:hypothetical protein